MPTSSNNDLNQMQDFADSFYHRPHDPTIEVPTGSAKPWPTKEDGDKIQSDRGRTRRPALLCLLCLSAISSPCRFLK